MNTIHKYPLEITDVQAIEINRHSKPIHVGLDPGGTPCLWCQVDDEKPKSEHPVYIVGTGNPIPDEARRHIGSFTDGPFVWHVFIA